MKALRRAILAALCTHASAALAAPFAYVASEGSDTVSVIDIATKPGSALPPWWAAWDSNPEPTG